MAGGFTSNGMKGGCPSEKEPHRDGERSSRWGHRSWLLSARSANKAFIRSEAGGFGVQGFFEV
jgi:hypothetical protein